MSKCLNTQRLIAACFFKIPLYQILQVIFLLLIKNYQRQLQQDIKICRLITKDRSQSPYSGNTIPSGYMPGYSQSKNPENLPTVYCKTPQSVKSVPVNPIDLSSKRTLRATPDSTAAEDHALYIEAERNMIPAHSAQAYITTSNHERRLVDVSATYVPHYGMNGVPGNHFGLIQGNGSIPPTTVPYEIFQQQRMSPSPAALSFSATHPLTSGILKRNPMYGNPSGTYEQYHPAGYPTASPAGYQIQPNMSRVSGDQMTSMYQASQAQGMRNAKHISTLDKNMPMMFTEPQMRKTPTSVATTAASVAHTGPMQTAYIQELQPSSYHSHSAFQKPVFSKECCTVGMPNRCSCFWSPPEQPVSSYSPAHRIINPVQAVHSLPAVNKSAVSSGMLEAHKPSPNYQLPEHSRMNHQIPHHHIQHDGSHKTHIEPPNHLQNHQENGIVGLQNTVLKLTSAAEQTPRTSETNGIDRPAQNFYNCTNGNSSKYNNLDKIKSGPSNPSTQNNNNNNISRPNLTSIPNHVRGTVKPKGNEQSSDVTYCKSVAIKNKAGSEYNPDPRQETHPIKKGYYQKSQQPSPGYYHNILNNRNEKNVINYNKQQNNNNNGENGSSSWVANPNPNLTPNSNEIKLAQNYTVPDVITQPIDTASRIPNCWRPPVSFPENGETLKTDQPDAVETVEKKDRPIEYTGLDCDKYPYQVNSLPPSTSKKQTLSNSVDDENRVSSSTDIIQSSSKTSNKQSQTPKLSPKEQRVIPVVSRPPSASVSVSLPKQSTSLPTKVVAAPPPISDEQRMLMIRVNEQKKLFESYSSQLWIWIRPQRYVSGHYKNLIKELEEDVKIVSKFERKFPKDWEKELAMYKLTVRVPRCLIKFPEGFEPPAVREKSRSYSSEKGLGERWKRQLFQLESKSESSDSSDSESEDEKEAKVKSAETKCKKPPVKKLFSRTTRSAELVRKKPEENVHPKRTSSYLSVRTRKRHESDSDNDRKRFSDDDSSADESSATNYDAWEKVKVPVSEKRKEREAKRTTDKRAPRKRSPLDQLACSDGYVAENKKPKTDNLYSHSSLLGREQRALQVGAI
ncbi:hypothetical protein GQR58_000636 [Nymphon striatum]|nr:hypothetical protein GQR58_000636 [Nymphon striatum]